MLRNKNVNNDVSKDLSVANWFASILLGFFEKPKSLWFIYSKAILVFFQQEESQRILAINSDLLSSQTRSCKDEPFLNVPSLQRKLDLLGQFEFYSLDCGILNFRSSLPFLVYSVLRKWAF